MLGFGTPIINIRFCKSSLSYFVYLYLLSTSLPQIISLGISKVLYKVLTSLDRVDLAKTTMKSTLLHLKSNVASSFDIGHNLERDESNLIHVSTNQNTLSIFSFNFCFVGQSCN